MNSVVEYESKDVHPQFMEWACSLSGCDGGEPSAPIWICGIEWGYAKKRSQTPEEYEASIQEYYEKELREEVLEGQYRPADNYNWIENLTDTYGKSVAKLFMALHGEKVNGQDVKIIGDTISKLPDSRLFKLNLYPIPFRYAHDDLWEKYKIRDLTGLESKETYRTWCFLNRFPSMTKRVKDSNPKLIVCTGITYLTDFFACFAGVGCCRNIHIVAIQPDAPANTKLRRYYWCRINEDRTVLAVIPFFSSQYGLNSDSLIEKVGSQLAKLTKL